MTADEYHTHNLMDRIHPALRDKYAQMLSAWRYEVRRWKMTPVRVSTSEHDVAPGPELSGPFSAAEDEIMRELYPVTNTKVLARVLNRTPGMVSGRAWKMGLRKRDE